MKREQPIEASKETPDVVAYLPWYRQFWLLLKIQFSDYRSSAAFFVVFSMVIPIGLLWVLGNYVNDTGIEAAWFLAGNVVVSVTFGSASFAVARVAWLHIDREIDYYGTLPIRRSAFLASLFTLSQISTFPGLVTSLTIGHFMLEIPFHRLLAAFPIIFLASFSLTVIGAAIGSYARTMPQVNLYSNLIIVVVTFFSPVLVPEESLLTVQRVATHLLPPGQAAMALTASFAGSYGFEFWRSVLFLLVTLFVSSFLAIRNLNWRGD